MKVCFPVNENKGLDSEVYGHFGSAPEFIICDTETEAVETIGNQDLGHEHGACSPLKALNHQTVDAIVVGGIGAGAIANLNSMGIKVYRAVAGTVKENLQLFKDNAMIEMTMNQACGGHGHGGGCGHH